MWGRPACQTLSIKALDILSATARVAPVLLKPLAILLDTIVRRSAVDREDLKLYLKSEKRPDFRFVWQKASFFVLALAYLLNLFSLCPIFSIYVCTAFIVNFN